MERFSEKTPDVQELKEKTNAILQRIGIEWQLTREEIQKVTDAVHLLLLEEGKRVTYVDDQTGIIRYFAYPLMHATEGALSVIHHEEQTMEVLIDEITNTHPTIALIDGRLATGITGDDLVKELNGTENPPHCIGFSGNPDFEKLFLRAGASGFVAKDVSRPEDTINELGEMIRSLRITSIA